MGSGYAKKKKEARLMEQHFQEMEESLANKQFVGSSGNGLVTITLNGKLKVLSVIIKPECIDPEDPECLQDLIMAAHQDAVASFEKDEASRSNFPLFV